MIFYHLFVFMLLIFIFIDNVANCFTLLFFIPRQTVCALIFSVKKRIIASLPLICVSGNRFLLS